MMARDFDSHVCEVTYRTVKMAERDAERLRSCGWRVHEFTGEPVLHVETYKPTVLFGPLDLQGPYRRPGDDAPCRERDRWDHGIVGWSLACGCEASRLDTDYRLAGVQAHLQPTAEDGSTWIGGDQYVIERVEWSCAERSNRACVAVRTLDDDGWRGRMIMVAESVIHNLLKESAA